MALFVTLFLKGGKEKVLINYLCRFLIVVVILIGFYYIRHVVTYIQIPWRLGQLDFVQVSHCFFVEFV